MGIFDWFLSLFSDDDDDVIDEASQARARKKWQEALAAGDRHEMEDAATELGDQGLEPEMLAAFETLKERWPDGADTFENNVGVHYAFEGEHEKALVHYLRSYELEQTPAGSSAEGNILESSLELAKEADDPEKAVRFIMRYFQVCTHEPASDATQWTVSDDHPDGATQSVRVERAKSALEALDRMEGYLAEVSNPSFVSGLRPEVDQLRADFTRHAS
ncbi:MAG: hypothetical protein AAGA56_23230 [Myxococcota bacterium]